MASVLPVDKRRLRQIAVSGQLSGKHLHASIHVTVVPKSKRKVSGELNWKGRRYAQAVFFNSTPPTKPICDKRGHQRCHFLETNARGRLVLPLKKITQCSQWSNTITNDLSNRQHGHGEDRARRLRFLSASRACCLSRPLEAAVLGPVLEISRLSSRTACSSCRTSLCRHWTGFA